MAVLTESEVRKRLGSSATSYSKEIYLSEGDIITPSAKSFLAEKDIKIKYHIATRENEENKELKEKVELKENKELKEGMEEEKKMKYVTLFGANLSEKPEHMTHLRGNTLVFKDHPRIAFRGKIDSLESNILEVQLITQKHNMIKLTEDLQEIISFIRNLIRCEVSGENVGDFRLQGLDKKDLREQSHHPSKYFGIKHFLPDYTMGELVVYLNKLRTLTRETELVAYNAFKSQYGSVEREDIIQALNRLSSLFWIMMFKVRAGQYK